MILKYFKKKKKTKITIYIFISAGKQHNSYFYLFLPAISKLYV